MITISNLPGESLCPGLRRRLAKANSIFEGLERFEHARSNPFIVRASTPRFQRERFLSELSKPSNEKTLTQGCQR
jgi:hypothetical protein